MIIVVRIDKTRQRPTHLWTTHLAKAARYLTDNFFLLTQMVIFRKKKQISIIVSLHTQKNSKLIIDLSKKAIIIKLLEKIIGENIHNLELNKNALVYTKHKI